jgi:hypothetical protein
MQALATHLATADIVHAFRQAGLRPLLLKKSAMTEPLSRSGELCSYVDVNLIVA